VQSKGEEALTPPALPLHLGVAQPSPSHASPSAAAAGAFGGSAFGFGGANNANAGSASLQVPSPGSASAAAAPGSGSGSRSRANSGNNNNGSSNANGNGGGGGGGGGGALKTPVPAVPSSFPELDAFSSAQLEDLMADGAVLIDEMVTNRDTVRAMRETRADLLAGVQTIASQCSHTTAPLHTTPHAVSALMCVLTSPSPFFLFLI
jgi:hypothetical protein